MCIRGIWVLIATSGEFTMSLYSRLKELITVIQLRYGWTVDLAVHRCSDFCRKLDLTILRRELSTGREITWLRILIHGIRFRISFLSNLLLALVFLTTLKNTMSIQMPTQQWTTIEQSWTSSITNSQSTERTVFGSLANLTRVSTFPIWLSWLTNIISRQVLLTN